MHLRKIIQSHYGCGMRAAWQGQGGSRGRTGRRVPTRLNATVRRRNGLGTNDLWLGRGDAMAVICRGGREGIGWEDLSEEGRRGLPTP